MEREATAPRAQLAELGRFIVVGGSAVAVDFLVYFALVHPKFAVPTALAKACSFIAGAILAFFLNRGFVFRARGALPAQAVAFSALYLTTLALNTGANALALSFGAAKPLAWFLATGTSTVSNFLGMKLLVFRPKHGVSLENR